LAAIGESGRLLDVRDASEDEEILDWIAQYADDCLVAIDAPIVVTNVTGQRPCERDLSTVFRRFNAGTHPTNLTKPEFAAGSRALALCERARLEVDPVSNLTVR
jgi:predicted RNase H-like nuclease